MPTFVPSTAQTLTEKETIRQSINDQQPHLPSQTVPWPPSSGTPINEFITEGYISRAFPTLFPTGAADFVAPRPNAVTVGNYFKHLLIYDDGRFARHPRFRYFALNTEMRWRALQAGRIYVRQHPHDARLSAEELRDMVGREGEAFSNRVLHYATSLRGTRQYWFKQRSRLIAMVDTLGLPTIFFTHSTHTLLHHNHCTTIKATHTLSTTATTLFTTLITPYRDNFQPIMLHTPTIIVIYGLFTTVI